MLLRMLKSLSNVFPISWAKIKYEYGILKVADFQMRWWTEQCWTTTENQEALDGGFILTILYR